MTTRAIKEVLARRTDLSTFIVHLTRDTDDTSARAALVSILRAMRIEARTPLGHAISSLQKAGASLDSQKVVCFTETPLEHVYLLLGKIERRKCDFGPYGIAITKRMARKSGANPVWYVDITPGHDWLSNSINELVAAAIQTGDFDNSPVAKLAPFIEQMGSGAAAGGTGGYRKEFWWEREWRHCGDFILPGWVIVLCPEDEVQVIKEEANTGDTYTSARFVDPRWGLEEILAHLGGFLKSDVEPF